MKAMQADVNIREILKEILTKFGLELFNDNRRLNALLKDLAPMLDRERKLISTVLDEGIGVRLWKASDLGKIEKNAIVKKSISDLVNDAWISEAGAAYAVYSIVYALSYTDVLEDEYIGNKNDEIENNEIESNEQENKNNILVKKQSKNKDRHNDKYKDNKPKSISDYNKRELRKGKHTITAFNLSSELRYYDVIGYKAFSCYKELTDIVIPDNVKAIGSKAFFGCGSLMKIYIPKDVEVIGELPFEGCYNLLSINVDKKNNDYYNTNYMLINKNTKNLVRSCIPAFKCSERYDIPEGIISISKKAFECIHIVVLWIPASLKSITPKSFFACEKFSMFIVDKKNQMYRDISGVLHSKDGKTLLIYPMGREGSYIIEDFVTKIGEAGFSHAEYLTSITIPGSVTQIGDKAFEYCINLSFITLPSSIISIGDNAFQYCTRLTNAVLPRNIVSIGDRAFEGCIELTRISIPQFVKTIGNLAFFNCHKLENVVIQNNVQFIGDGAFAECSPMFSLTVRRGSYAEIYGRARGIKLNYI